MAIKSPKILVIGFLLGSILFANACVRGPGKRSDEKSGSSASFFINSIGGSSETATVDAAWGLPKTKLFNFKVCLKDVARSQAIPGQDFKIEMTDPLSRTQTSKDVKTDSDGCLHWSESIAFNYLANPTFIPLERKITGAGDYRGTVDANFAVNPWKKGSAAVVDLDDNSVAQILDPAQVQNYLSGHYLEHQGSDSKPHIWVDSIETNIQELRFEKEASGLVVDFEITSQPFIRKKDEEGQWQTHPIEKGEFEVMVYLFARDNDDSNRERSLLAQFAGAKSATLNRGRITVNDELTIKNTLPRAEVEVGLRLTPIKGPGGLKDFEGVFSIGPFKNLVGKSSGRIKEKVLNKNDKIINLSDFSADVKPVELSVGAKDAKFNIDTIRVFFAGVGENETTTWRTVNMTVYACIGSPFNNEKYRHRKFRVHKMIPEGPDFENFSKTRDTSERETNNEGCLSWNDSLRHKTYGIEEVKRKSVFIEDIQSGLSRELEIAVNPWDGGWTFGRDGRLLEDKVNLQLSAEDAEKIERKRRGHPELILKNYLTDTAGVDYQIDDLLNMKLVKKYNFMAWLFVARETLRWGKNSLERLRRGHYLLRMVIRKPRDDRYAPLDYIDSFEKIVKVESGVISTDITFEFDEMEYLVTRNEIIIEILPIIENQVRFEKGRVASKPSEVQVYLDSGLKLKSFSGPFIPSVRAHRYTLPYSDYAYAANFDKNAEPEDIPENSEIVEEKVNGASLIAAGEKVKAARKQKREIEFNLQNFGISNGLQLVDLGNPEHVRIMTEKGLPIEAAQKLIDESGIENPPDELLPFLRDLCFSMNLSGEKSLVDADEVEDREGTCDEVPLNYFSLDRKVHTSKINPRNSQFIGGRTQNLGVGQSFSLGAYRDNGKTAGSKTEMGTTTQGSLTGLSILGVFGAMFKAISSVAGLNVNHSVSAGQAVTETSSEGEGFRIGLDVSKGAYLLVQQAAFSVEFSQYQRCISITPYIEFWARIQEDKASNQLGLHLCLPEENTPRQFLENYYLINQHFNEAPMLDFANLHNIPWVLLMRGHRDFIIFLKLLENARTLEQIKDRDTPVVEVLGDSYEEFLNKYRMYPGVYTVLDQKLVPTALKEIDTKFKQRAKFAESLDVFNYLRPTEPGK